jgi:predicted transcriptional regulator
LKLIFIEGDKLVGQISRRDVLRAIQDSTNYDMDTEEINGYITQEMKGSLSK